MANQCPENKFLIPLYILFLSVMSAFSNGVTNKDQTEYPPSVLHLFPTQENRLDLSEDGVTHSDQNNEQNIPAIHVSYAHSPLYLTHLAQTERHIYNALVNYERQLLTRLEIIQRYRTDFEESVHQEIQLTNLHDDWWNEATAVAGNPLQAYRMIRRFARDLQGFTNHIWQSLENELWESLETWRGIFSWPSEVDLIGAAKSVIRLQSIHDFDVHHFSDGIIQDKILGFRLTAEQCLELSQISLSNGDIQSATDWFQAAHFKVVHSDEKSITMDQLTEAWEITYTTFQANWPLQQFKTHDVFNEAKTLLRKEFDNLKANRSFQNRMLNYKALCRGDGDTLKTDAEDSDSTRLKCYLDNIRNPYWYLNPLRIEVHSWRPFIYQVHNFIESKTIVEISESVVASMSYMAESGASVHQPNDLNTYTHSWISDATSYATYSLSRKIELLTGFHALKFGDSQGYHVSAFAVGNHYEPSFGYPETESEAALQELGRKMTTVHVTLHEPGEGGELAYTLLGILIKPTRGSLIVYNNLQLNGEINERILHGSCPVLLGQKWIATKWIYEYENFNKRPCPIGSNALPR